MLLQQLWSDYSNTKDSYITEASDESVSVGVIVRHASTPTNI